MAKNETFPAAPVVPASPVIPASVAVVATPLAPIKLVPASALPARVVGQNAKDKLAAYQAEQKAARNAESAPLIKGLLAGQALTDGVSYTTAALANKPAQNAKRLVESGLLLVGQRPSVRVTGEGSAFQWFVTAIVKVPQATNTPDGTTVDIIASSNPAGS